MACTGVLASALGFGGVASGGVASGGVASGGVASSGLLTVAVGLKKKLDLVIFSFFLLF